MSRTKLSRKTYKKLEMKLNEQDQINEEELNGSLICSLVLINNVSM